MIVFTNGCFDIVHRGHLELLKYCDSIACPAMGGCVVVGLNSDASVKKLKGQNRPINNQEDRKFHLESLKFVYEVIIFEEETPYELIKSVKPNIIVKGGDYEKENVVGSDLCKVRIFDYKQEYSTTSLLSKI
jgi:D-beta-D-heptose 7-phosphate kinase/D-beta-D-heptose 1-phosphate adenosyltransferase